ncbi:probable G-protein coupled receptor B0563.6 [Paramacrobiotus metropolitanus]|uniref:probable G-protein coupled receptor B0563.6 n=1 Tax=Paramacrobiotus metropolitanus TaxID=2943436 RepID=UPI0024465B9E|nr:probable G-protein coupled receptor B0563.6 [Paramacrobiotus metropolitanus]
MFFNANDSLKISIVHNFSMEAQNPYDPDIWRQSVPWSGNFTYAQRVQATFVFIALYPVLLAACTIGNVLNLIVLISAKRQNTTNSYMIAVAVADLVVLWVFFPPYLWNTSATLHLPYYNKKNYATTLAVLPHMISIQDIFIQMCDWVLVAFSLERLLAISRPLTFKWVQRATTARIVIVLLLLFSIVFNSGNLVSNWYLWRYQLTPAALPIWLKHWAETQNVAEVVISFLKFFGLLGINVLVINALRRQQRSDIGQQRVAQAKTSVKRSKSCNYLLLGSVFLYLITVIPVLIFKFLELADTFQVYNFDESARLFVNPFCDVAMLTNYSVNFFLYLTVSEKYRAQFMRIFGGVMCPVWLKRNWSMGTDNSWSCNQQRSRLHGNLKEQFNNRPTVKSC